MSRESFSKTKITNIFNKAKIDINEDSKLWRRDRKNRKIYRPAYGDHNSKYGWNIHHKDKNSKNNSIDNLEAVHFDTHDEINH